MILYAALHTLSFVHGKMYSDWFNGIEILQGRWQHGEKVGYCYPSGLEKTVCKWDLYICPAGHEKFKRFPLFQIFAPLLHICPQLCAIIAALFAVN
jgi:hypothetical protein